MFCTMTSVFLFFQVVKLLLYPYLASFLIVASVHPDCTPMYTTPEKLCTLLYTFSRIYTHKVMQNEQPA